MIRFCLAGVLLLHIGLIVVVSDEVPEFIAVVGLRGWASYVEEGVRLRDWLRAPQRVIFTDGVEIRLGFWDWLLLNLVAISALCVAWAAYLGIVFGTAYALMTRFTLRLASGIGWVLRHDFTTCGSVE